MLININIDSILHLISQVTVQTMTNVACTSSDTAYNMGPWWDIFSVMVDIDMVYILCRYVDICGVDTV